MYEEEGYNPTDIPELIITKNLYGIDIDDRAAQLASFALMMKGRKHYRRFFRKNIAPNITAFQNIESHPKFENAKVLGSLIKITKEEANAIEVDETSLFAQEQIQLKKQAGLIANTYDIVVTNPPYLNTSYMEGTLKQYVDREYNTTKSDLFACFQVQASNLTKEDGLIGFICPYVWMFIKSYEWLRENTISNTTIASLIQLEYNAFGPAVVPICTFVLRNQLIKEYKGSYIKLSKFKGVENQKPRTLEAINNQNCGWFYTAIQKNFETIPSSLIGYWLSERMIKIFDDSNILDSLTSVRQGMATSDNNRFLKYWNEVSFNNLGIGIKNRDEANQSLKKWFPYNKGGSYRKWFGNIDYVVNWKNDGQEIKNYRDYKNSTLSSNMGVAGLPFIFKPNITWSKVTAGKFSVRYLSDGFLFDVSGCSIYDDYLLEKLLPLMNSKVITKLLFELSPTMNYEVGHIKALPIFSLEFDVKSNSEICLSISKQEWNSRETSWDFNQNEFIKHKSQDLEETYELYQQYWKNKFFQLHKNEEELNKQFIDIYGLQEEV